MSSSPQRIIQLIIKRLKDEATPEEDAELDAYSNSSAENQALIADLTDPHILAEMLARQEKAAPQKKHIRRLLVWTAAAALVLILATSIWYLLLKPLSPGRLPVLAQSEDGQSFILLPDGNRIPLDQKADGPFMAGNTQLIKKGNQLICGAVSITTGEPDYLRLFVQQAKYELVFADSSKVSMSTATAIGFPGSFRKHGREVQLSGQAYLEVTGNTADTFSVTLVSNALDTNPTVQGRVKATGTRFNIRAYTNEPRQVISLEAGHLLVCKNNLILQLQPGEEAVLQKNKLYKQPTKYPGEASLWHTGKFWFTDTDLLTVMRDIERQYGVTVNMDSAAMKKIITVHGSRDQPLKDILNMIGSNDNEVSIVVNGKKITVKASPDNL